MPQRSNEFQRLVFLVKKVLAGSAVVTESKMLADRRTGSPREVDVCIEAVVSNHNVTVSIECCDHGRPADVTWVERMKAKHEHLATNALVLASRSGYTDEAVAVAQAEDIEIVRYEELEQEEDVRKIFGLGSSAWARIYKLSPTKVVATTAATGDLPDERVSLASDHAIYTAQGIEMCSVMQLVKVVLAARQISEAFAQEGNESHRSFTVSWTPPPAGSGSEIFLQKPEPRLLMLIERLEVTGKCEVSPKSEFRLHQGVLGPIRVVWGTGTLGKASVMVVGTTSPGSEPRLTLDLRSNINITTELTRHTEKELEGE